MIKINISPEKMKEIEDKHLMYANQCIKTKLNDKLKKLDKLTKPKEFEFYELMSQNYETIIIGKPSELKKLVAYDESTNSQGELYLAYLEALNERYSKKINKSSLISEIDSRIKSITDKSKDKLNTLKQNIESNSKLSDYNSLCQVEDEGIHKEVKKLEKKEKNAFDENIKNIFNYSSFSNGKKVNSKASTPKFNWGAYPLLKALDVKVCPYCNRQYISIDEGSSTNKGKTRPELDHFLCQSEFPFFSASLYNLIPSCHVCNSNLKSDIKFIKTKKEETDGIKNGYIVALNPYENGFNENYTFTLKDNYDFLFMNSSDFTIAFKENIQCLKSTDSILKQKECLKQAQGNNTVFHLETLYNQNHKDIVYELIQKFKVYTMDYLDELLNSHPEIFKSKKELMQMVLSNYIEQEDMNKRPFSKLTHDIAQELGILEYLE